MKRIQNGLIAGMLALSGLMNVIAQDQAKSQKVQGPVGLQLYSLRAQFAKDVPGTLDKVRDYGLKYVELAGTYGMPPAKFRSELESRGLEAVSAHFSYERFRDDLEKVVSEAKVLGVKYAGCAWIPHEGAFDEPKARAAAAVFNRAGERLSKDGIRFFYHIHGFEFRPHDGGTIFDLLVKETDAKHVTFEMDVFWAVHGGQDPVKLFEKYPKRWELTHLKGMKESTPTGLHTGSSDVNNDVALNSGKIDYAPVIRAANKAGVKYHFIEDESPVSEKQIAESLKYLSQFNWK